jgi:hypothetical protein
VLASNFGFAKVILSVVIINCVIGFRIFRVKLYNRLLELI